MDGANEQIGLFIADAFAEDGFRESLQLIADGVRDVAGFDVAAISVLRDSDLFEFIAVSGNDEAAAMLIGHFNPRESVMADLAHGEDWGRFRFVPPGSQQIATTLTWVPSVSYPGEADSWHPENLLCAPLRDDDDRLIGLLSLDLPRDGKVPGPDRRRLLDLYADQAGRVLSRALQRTRLTEQVRLADAARQLVRTATAGADVKELIATCEPLLVEAFRARGLWIQVFDEAAPPVRSIVGVATDVPDDLESIAVRAARICWDEQRTGVVSTRRTNTGIVDDAAYQAVLKFLAELGRSSILFAPLGAGQDCLGILALTRSEGDEEWSDVEAAAGLDFGRDLGRMLANARTSARDRRLMAELEALDRYKGQLIATITHELKNPLTAIRGHLEMLEENESVDELAAVSIEGMRRSTDRLSRLVDNLLLLNKVGESGDRALQEVDLCAQTAEAVQLLGIQATKRGIGLSVDLPGHPAPVVGIAEELSIVCTNLISNAIKYTGEGGRVHTGLSVDGDQVVLRVTDDGIGISADDQQQLFTEFFRSSDPLARDRPGTGLGLAIVARIVERCGGTVHVESELGAGSTFTVRLPLLVPASDPA